MGSWLTIGSWVVRRYRHKVVVRLSWVWNHDVDRELHFGNDLALWLQDYMGSVRVPICALGIFTANGFSVHDLQIAVSLYKSALSKNLRLYLRHFNALLYLYSNFATDPLAKDLAINYGFCVFNHMFSNKVVPNEALVTFIVMLASTKKNGDYAFELIKKMNKKYNLVPQLMTYDPTLLCFCENLEKLRNSMRCVSDEKVKAIEDWFCREKATGVKRVSFDEGSVKEVVLKNGGGWHGLRWIGTSIGFQREGVWIRMENAVFCGHELVSVDINDAETEKFARSIAGLAMEKKVKANFSKFQVSGFVSPWISSI
ncbi:hypothetical protein QYF36_016520 [Acer negundo]|nr:hypothetical protein QYF36_016520 [Acer negundo]